LAHIVLSFSPSRAIQYHIYDVPEAAALQRRVLRTLGWSEREANASSLNPNLRTQKSSEPVCDIIISDVALSELDATTQYMYAAKLLFSARVGMYLAYNIISTPSIMPWLSEFQRHGLDVDFIHPIGQPRGNEYETGQVYQQCPVIVARKLEASSVPQRVTSLDKMKNCSVGHEPWAMS